MSDWNSRIDGAAFRAELRYSRLRFWLPYEKKTRTVKTANVKSATIQPNGYTKIVVRLGKDLTIPTSATEAVQLVKTVNELISETESVYVRNRLAARKDQYRRRKLL